MATKKSMWVFIGILVISVWILGSGIQAMAETMNYEFYTWVIKSESASIGDMDRQLSYRHPRAASSAPPRATPARPSMSWSTSERLPEGSSNPPDRPNQTTSRPSPREGAADGPGQALPLRVR